MIKFSLDMTLPQYEQKKRLTVEDFKELWNIFKKGKTKEKTHDIFCFCPSCLFHLHKLLPENKGSKVKKRNFFVGFVILAMQQEREKNGKKYFRNKLGNVDNILPEIDFEEFCQNGVDVNKNGSRYLKIVEKTCEEKIEILKKIIPRMLRGNMSPNVQVSYIGSCKLKVLEMARLLAIRKLIKKDQEKRERIVHHIKRAIEDNQSQAVSERELQRRTGFKKYELDWLLSFCEGKAITWDRFRHKISLTGEELNNPLEEIIEEIKLSLRSVGMVK